MSTRQKPLSAPYVYFDRQRFALGLPQIAPGLDRRVRVALGVDLAADKAQGLVPDGTDIDGPVPAGGEPAGLLRSAEVLLRRIAPIAAWEALDDLRDTVADLVWEANTGVDA
jgi:hypothetical protein